MPKRRGIFFVVTGAVFLFISLSLFLHNSLEEDRAGEESQVALQQVQEEITDRTGQSDQTKDPKEESLKRPSSHKGELPVVVIDGYEYIGYLSIPALKVELPVMAEWDYERLRIAPCRQFGSTATDDLVIAAHNYRRHFAYLGDLEVGDVVRFTDMDGNLNQYEVASVDENLRPTDVDSIVNSDHDLILYTCTYTGQARIVIYCDRVAIDVEKN